MSSVQGSRQRRRPDLATLSGKPLSHWLTAILDPNAALEDKFISYTAILKNNTAHVGVITGESPTSLTLRTATGQPHTILRRDLAKLESTNLSLMPNGSRPPCRCRQWPICSVTCAACAGAVGVAKTDVTPKHPWCSPVTAVAIASMKASTANFGRAPWSSAASNPSLWWPSTTAGSPPSSPPNWPSLAKHGIPRERLVVAATHTHNAPNLTGYAPILWAGRMNDAQKKNQAKYTAFAIDQMEAAVVAALKAREPMELDWAQGRVGFGGNRRVLNNGKWAGFGFQRSGPVDHSLPVLAARDAEGRVRAVWANYACHCTTVGAANRGRRLGRLRK